MTPQLDAISRQINESLGSSIKAIGASFAKAWQEAKPENWKDLSTEEILSVVDLMEATGLCLVWTPRAAIVRELLDDPDFDAFRIVQERRAEILSDLSDCLDQVAYPEFDELCEAAGEAIACDREGHHRAAQALTASIFTTMINVHLGQGTTDARKQFGETHPRDAYIGHLRIRSIFVAAKQAVAEYNPLGDGPSHRRFNRHNTVHRVTPEQFTERNSLMALMLVVPFMRELGILLAAEAKRAQMESAQEASGN
jgi:hypothetical protein